MVQPYAQYPDHKRRKNIMNTDRTKRFFVNTCILCGTVVVVAITVKVVMSLFI